MKMFIKCGLHKLRNSFNSKSREFADVVKIARTHCQDAVPMTVGDEFKVIKSLNISRFLIYSNFKLK